MSHVNISVCIATYNGADFILEQIQSILPQLKDEDEIIVSDDYSTDRTVEIIKSINDCRINIIYNKGEKGYTSNFENALKEAKGEYVFLADQDDIWMSNKVEILIRYLEKNDMVVSDAIVVDKERRVLENSFLALRPRYNGFLGNIYRFSYLGCCMAFRRRLLEYAIPFPSKRKLCTHDNWLFIIGSFFGKTEIVNIPLIQYRRHGMNTSSGANKNMKKNSLLFMTKYRLYVLLYIAVRCVRTRYFLDIFNVKDKSALVK